MCTRIFLRFRKKSKKPKLGEKEEKGLELDNPTDVEIIKLESAATTAKIRIERPTNHPTPTVEEYEEAVQTLVIWTMRSLLQDCKYPWVLFECGTCVMITGSDSSLQKEDPRAVAIKLLKKYGHVSVGTPAGDFSVNLPNGWFGGWLVGSHHPDVITYVDRSEMEGIQVEEEEIGLYGRTKRNKDAEDLVTIYVKENTQNQPEPEVKDGNENPAAADANTSSRAIRFEEVLGKQLLNYVSSKSAAAV